jgi:hypothetical protein
VVFRSIFAAAAVCCAVDPVSAQQYINLLEGENVNRHWMKPNGSDVTAGWTFEPGNVLRLKSSGNMVTREQYGDFELWFEFKVAAKGNSGIKYRVKQYGNNWLGLEYQVLDDAAFPKLTRAHLTGSLYDLVDPIPAVTRLRPAGEFNVGKVRIQNQRAQHWVNGQLMIDAPLSGPSWKSYVANSKFRQHDGFGENLLGHIMLTDHKSETWYRNVFLRRLGCSTTCGTVCVDRSKGSQ